MTLHQATLAAIIACLYAPLAHAATVTWDGGHASSPNWGNPNNWTGNATPDTTDTVRFGNNYPSSGFSSGTPNLNADRTALELRINHSGSRDILTTSTDVLTLTNGDLNRNASSTNSQTIGSTIQLGNTGDWDIKGSGSLILNAKITGPHPLNKTGEANLIFDGSTDNDYTGTTTVSDGTLQLDKNAGTNAIPADLTITGTAEVELLKNNQINDASNLTLNGGTLRLAGNNETFNNADLQAGLLHLGNGDLTLEQITHTASAELNLGNADTNTLTINSGTLTGPVDGQGTFLKTGTGTLEFEIGNANNRTLDINNGTLKTSTTTANKFTNTITVSSSSTLQLNDDTDQTLTAPLSGSGTILKSGTGTLTYDASPGSKFALQIDDGALAISAITANQLRNKITINAPGTLQLDDTFDTLLFIELKGTGNLLKTGSFTTLIGQGAGDNAANTHSGTTTVDQGELHLNKANNTNAIGGNLIVNNTATAQLLFDNQIPDTATVTINDNATFNTDNNTETIQTLNLNDGQFRLATTTASTTDQDFTTTTINDTGDASIFLGNGTSNKLIVQNGNIASPITGQGALRKESPDTLTFTAPITSPDLKLKIAEGTFATTPDRLNGFTTIQGINGTLSLSGAGTINKRLTGTDGQLIKTGPDTITIGGSNSNTYTGDTTIEDGTLIFNKNATTAVAATVRVGDDTGDPQSATLQLAQDNQIQAAANVNVRADGHFDMNTHSDQVTKLSGTGNVTLGGTLAVQETTDDFTFNGTLKGPGGLTANHTTTFTLGGTTPNTYTGLTELNDGTLHLNKPDGTDALAGDIQINNIHTTLKLLQNNNLPDTTNITIQDDAVFDLTDQTETINNLSGSLFAKVILGHLTVGADNGSSTFQGFFNGTGSLTKTGTGTLTLDRAIANNNIDLIIDNGTVITSTISANFFNTPITINGTLDLDSNLQLDPTDDDTLTRTLAGEGQLIKSGPAKTRIGTNDNADNTNSGLTTINAGTLEFNKSNNTDAIGGDLLINNATALYNRSNQLPDSATVTVNNGTFDLNTNNETINTLILNTALINTTDANFTTTTLTDDGLSDIQIGATHNNTLTIHDGNLTSPITGSGNLTKTGPGTLTFNAPLADTIDLTINEGTFHTTTPLARTLNTITIDPLGELRLQDTTDQTFDLNVTGTGTLNFQYDAPTTVTLDATYAHNGPVTMGSTGTLLLDPPNSAIKEKLTNHGTVKFQKNNRIDDNADIENHATINLNGHFDEINKLTNHPTGTINLGTSGHLTVNSGSSSGSIKGNFGTLTKQGPGTFTLSGTNEYTSGTFASGGTLNIASTIQTPLAISNATVTMLADNLLHHSRHLRLNSGTLDLNGTTQTTDHLFVTVGASRSVINGTLHTTDITSDSGGIFSAFLNINNASIYIQNGLFVSNIQGNGNIIKTGTTNLELDLLIDESASINLAIKEGLLITTPTVANGFNNPITIDSSGKLRLKGTGTSTLQAELTGDGELQKITDGTIQIGQGTTDNTPNTNMGLTTISNGSLHFFKKGNTDAIGGDLTINAGSAKLLHNNQLPDTRTVTVNDGTFDLDGKNETIGFLQLNAPGTTNLGNGANLTTNIAGNGTLTGTGTIIGDVNLDGTTAPGTSPGIINITGAYTAGPLATLQIEVKNPTTPTPTPGTDHDQLAVTGPVTLNGTLEIIPLPDPATIDDTFPGALGTTYDILTYTTRTGFFTNITGTLLSTEFALAPLINDTDDTLQLRATIPGDLNLDNKVSVADLAEFALNFDTTPGLHNETDNQSSWLYGDFNTDGAITVADLSLLALNFGFELLPDGTSVSPTPLSLLDAASLAGIPGVDLSAATSIPEPASSLLFILLITPAALINNRTSNKYTTSSLA